MITNDNVAVCLILIKLMKILRFASKFGKKYELAARFFFQQNFSLKDNID